ncbi:hypothetical protein GCM10009863_41660 [Streptomyces axinellae]|uniref:Uncharacterized protein n=1 Tax=Streptomyces axinellae TaxID=552788 RepID=A0ABN3QCT7_9ACTN
MPGDFTPLELEFAVAYLAATEDWHRQRGRRQGETVEDGPPRPHHLEMQHRKEEAILYLSTSQERLTNIRAAMEASNYKGGPLPEAFPWASVEDMQHITSFANEHSSNPRPNPNVAPPPYAAGQYLPAGAAPESSVQVGTRPGVQAGARPGSPAPPPYSPASRPPRRSR